MIGKIHIYISIVDKLLYLKWIFNIVDILVILLEINYYSMSWDIFFKNFVKAIHNEKHLRYK